MTYKNIKKILRDHIKNNVRTLWTFDEINMEFTCVYSEYKDELQIYTPQQLLDRIEELEDGI